MLVATGAGEKNSREMEAPYARYGENDVTTPNPAWLIRVYSDISLPRAAQRLRRGLSGARARTRQAPG
jgi:hypothetical protein